jgi:copper transport protein
MTRIRRLLLAAGLLVLLLVATPGVASAHAQLESTDPSQSSVLLVPPTQVVLHFGEPVEIDFGSLRVLGPGGKRVDGGAAHHPDGDTHSVAISLASDLPDGTYVVAWRVISADSHPVHGAYVFSVGTAAGAARANSLALRIANQPGDATVGVVYWILRAAAFAGLLVLVGLAVLVSVLWPEGGRTRRIGRVLWWSWGVLVGATLLGVLIQGVYASALPLTDAYRPSLLSAVLHTRFGEVELLRILLLAAMVPVLLALRGRFDPGGRRGRWVTPVACVVGLGLLATPGLAGHASTGSSPVLGLGLDVVHLAAATAWIGGLTLLATFLLPRRPGDAWPPDPLALTLQVSAVAFGAVLVVIATGVVQTIRQVGSWYALFHTTYGRTLVIKICLVVVLIGLGALSRRAVHGGLFRRGRRTGAPDDHAPDDGERARATSTGPGPTGSTAVLDEVEVSTAPADFPRRRLLRTVVAELVIALAVVGVTAALVNDAPARQAVSQPFTHSFSTLGVQVNTIIDPALAGQANEVHIYVLSSSGTPKAIPELDLSATLASQSIGPLDVPLVVSGPGHYIANRFVLPVAGNWVLTYTVRIDAIDEQVVTTVMPVR